MQIRISVRTLVEFLLRNGNIDNRRGASSGNAMAEGSRIHRMIQRRMGSDYQAEVPLGYRYYTGRYEIWIEGRADGVISEKDGFTIDEIKGTYRDLERMKEPDLLHLAQAKCYAYIYGLGRQDDSVQVRMTYCNLDTEEIRYFYLKYSFAELEKWFLGLVKQYQKWADLEYEWKALREKSIHGMEFPYSYRKGQKELATHVYHTICHKRKLFLEAPTGVGKTLSVVFPAIKAIGEKKGDKLFYLTAKTITRTVAEETFLLLQKNGLSFKTVVLTAKEKICFQEETECNPLDCPYAKGHFDRINEALYDILTHEVNYSRELIEEYAVKHQVCPFEMALDISLFSDGIVCDYNYLFDPHVYLRRFFGENGKGEYLFLVDEAHNLVERGREMYSARLWKEDFLELKRTVKDADAKIARHLESCNRALLAMKRECEEWRIVKTQASFVLALTRLHAVMEKFLEEQEESPGVSRLRKEVLEFYFQVSHYLEMYELIDDNYVTYTKLEDDGRFFICLFCVNPANNLRECMDRGVSSILFSATLLPIQYYKGLLGGEERDYEVYAGSTFDSRRQGLFVGCDVTTRYTRRGKEEYGKIARYLYEIVKNRKGNYLFFFPSYHFLREVYDIYEKEYWDGNTQECILQEENMNERAREAFLRRFLGNGDCDFTKVICMDVEIEEEKSLLGFCVMGGIFSEGIDLKKDSLIGAVIVGCGLPQICAEREILRQYFEGTGQNGFDYAYRYPGMNKVLQSSGRVIRTAEDVGIVALLDDRFNSTFYQRLFPREWALYEKVTVDTIGKSVEQFWKKWL